MNWANEILGAKLVDFSSELPGCEAINILHDDISTLWLSEEGLPQWICISLEDCWRRTGQSNIIIKTIGWYCWHSYSTNPKTVTVHVSKEGSKFKQWDTCVASSQTDNTQRFCCAPINTTLYPFIALEVTSTFGGSQTYMNNVFFYSDEVPASPVIGLTVNDSCQYQNTYDYGLSNTSASFQSSTKSSAVLEEDYSAPNINHSIPAVVFATSVEVSNVTPNDDLLDRHSSMDTEVLADQLSAALGLGMEDDQINNAKEAGILMSSAAEECRVACPRVSSESFSSISAVEQSSSSGSFMDNQMQNLDRDQTQLMSKDPKDLDTEVPEEPSSSVQNLLQSLSSVQRALDDLSTFTTSTQHSRRGTNTSLQRTVQLDNLLTSFDGSSHTFVSSERIPRVSLEIHSQTPSVPKSPVSVDSLQHQHQHPHNDEQQQQQQQQQQRVADRLCLLEDRFSRLLDLMEGPVREVPLAPPPPPPPRRQTNTSHLKQMDEEQVVDFSTLEVLAAVDPESSAKPIINKVVVVSESESERDAMTETSIATAPPSELQIEELVRKVLFQIAQTDKAVDKIVNTESADKSRDSIDILARSDWMSVSRSKECAAAMSDDRVRRRERLLTQLREEAGLETGDADLQVSFGIIDKEEEEDVHRSSQADEEMEKELVLSAAMDVLDRSIFELLEAKYHHRRSAERDTSEEVEALSPTHIADSPHMPAPEIRSLPIVRRSIDREQQTDRFIATVPSTSDVAVGTSPRNRCDGNVVITKNYAASQTQSTSSGGRVMMNSTRVPVREVSSDVVDQSRHRMKVLTIEIKSEQHPCDKPASRKVHTQNQIKTDNNRPTSSRNIAMISSSTRKVSSVEQDSEFEDCELELLARQLRAKILQRTLKAVQLQVLETRHQHTARDKVLRLT